MSETIIRTVPVSGIPGATPGRPGGVIAVVRDDRGQEIPLTATQYHAQDHEKIRMFDLWQEVRLLDPRAIHPDDFRALYPQDAKLSDQQIKERLKLAADRRV